MGTITHESYVHAVAQAAMNRIEPEEREKAFSGVKLVYGAGQAGLRGVTYYKRWNGKAEADPAPFVEVCAFGQESHVQLAGTVIHELAHVLAGWEAGHGKAWREACQRLGLRRARAAGHVYMLAGFEPDIRHVVASLPKPDDGAPVAALPIGPRGGKPKSCVAGVGTRGGKSRGAGSGSRLRLWECEGIGHKPYKVRIATDDFRATCDCCNTAFMLKT